jgi:hypothetical protein
MTGGFLPPWGTAADVYFSKFLVRPFIFQKSKKKIYSFFDFLVSGSSLPSIQIFLAHARTMVGWARFK